MGVCEHVCVCLCVHTLQIIVPLAVVTAYLIYIDDDATPGTIEEVLLNQLELVMEGMPGKYMCIIYSQHLKCL